MPKMLIHGANNLQWLFDMLEDPLCIKKGTRCAEIECSPDLQYILNAKFYRALPKISFAQFEHGTHFAEWDQDGEWVNPMA